jgi:cation/acetate symporter
MFGTAGLPHVLSRFYMVPGIRDARWGVVWGLFFIALIYWSAPAYGVLGRLFEARSGMPFFPDPANADMVILTAVSNAGLPLWVVGLLVAGGMSAAFSTVAGLMLTGSASFSHDIYPRLIRPGASENDKVYAAKGFFLILAAVVMVLAFKPWGMIAEIAALAFALAGNTLFPAFLLGIWWDRANAAGVIAGMLSGVLITFLPFVVGDALPMVSRLLPATSSAFIGAPLVISVMVVVSLLTTAPSESIRRFLARDVHDCTED